MRLATNSGTDRVVDVLCAPLSADSPMRFTLASMPLFGSAKIRSVPEKRGSRRIGLAAVKQDAMDLRGADGIVVWHRALAPADAAATPHLTAISDQQGPRNGRSP
jgi:hypothetical protein